MKDACSAWVANNAPSMGAGLAFYALFSLAPVLIIAVTIAGFGFGKQAAEQAVLGQFQTLMGSTGAKAVDAVIQSVNRPTLGLIASTIGVIAVLAGASGAFVELQDSLNKIWKVRLTTGNIWLGAVKQRFWSFGLVVGTGFLLLVSLVISAALGAMGKFLGHLLPMPLVLLESLNFVLSFAVITLLFAIVFKLIPDTRIFWSDVWMGAVLASLLFTFGKVLIGLYLGRSALASAYGAAASLVIFLLWIYYSAQILLLGAEITHAYANKHGSRGALAVPPRRLPTAETGT
jgi:membrane protein